MNLEKRKKGNPSNLSLRKISIYRNDPTFGGKREKSNFRDQRGDSGDTLSYGGYQS